MFKNILVPIDGSDHAWHALRVACDLAQKYGARLHLVHAMPPIPIEPSLGYYPEIIADRAQAADALLAQAQEEAKNCVADITLEQHEGSEAEVILEKASKYACDLIVMGTRGLGRLAGLLLGSVSQKIVQHAKCPVLLVR